jgi:hypothetical protein
MIIFSPEDVYANVGNICCLDYCLAIPIDRWFIGRHTRDRKELENEILVDICDRRTNTF